MPTTTYSNFKSAFKLSTTRALKIIVLLSLIATNFVVMTNTAKAMNETNNLNSPLFQSLTTLMEFAPCSGYWTSDADLISCTYDESVKNRGYVLQLDNPILETGNSAGSPALLTVPPEKYNGVINGAFQLPEIQRGDKFEASVGCQHGAINCNVSFNLSIYDVVKGKQETIWGLKDKYDGRISKVEVNLDRLVGKKDIFLIMSASANGSSDGDLPLWINPRIVRALAIPNTPIPATPTTTIPNTPTQLPETPTAISTPDNCNKALFIQDMTVPDGTVLLPEQTFTKTWRIQNSGDCMWDTSYSLVFTQGDQMSESSSIPLTGNVLPGQMIDISVNLKSPSSPGAYRGFWMLRNSTGQLFGIGDAGNDPLWVGISVTAAPISVSKDFVADMCNAVWSNGAGTMACPGIDNSAGGFVQQTSNPTLANGTIDPRPTLLVSLADNENGWLQGSFPEFLVKTNDHFQATVSCQYQVSACDVIYRLDYQLGNGPVGTLWAYHYDYQGTPQNVDIDLSMFAGINVKFILTVLSNGLANGDRVYWVAPRIVQVSVTTPATQTPAAVTP